MENKKTKTFTVVYNGKTTTHDEPVRILDIVGPDKNLICAYVNGRVRELTFLLNRDAILETKTLDNGEGIRIYQTSLRFVAAMAMKRI